MGLLQRTNALKQTGRKCCKSATKSGISHRNFYAHSRLTAENVLTDFCVSAYSAEMRITTGLWYKVRQPLNFGESQ